MKKLKVLHTVGVAIRVCFCRISNAKHFVFLVFKVGRLGHSIRVNPDRAFILNRSFTLDKEPAVLLLHRAGVTITTTSTIITS